MKILKRITTLSIITLMIFSVTSSTLINTLASSSINANYRKVANVAVLLYSFDDPYLLQIKQYLEDIEKGNKNKVNYTFYDGKNNIAVQNETLDSLLNSSIDLFIIYLADTKENEVEDVISKVKQSGVPLILTEISPEVVSKVSKYYNKVAFLLSFSQQAAIVEGKILVDLWNNNKDVIDKNGDDTMQYVLLKGKENNIIADERTKDVISTINNSGIKTEQLTLINANWSRELAKDSVSSLFLQYGDRIEAIIANSDQMAIGAVEALQKYGYNTGDKSKYIPVVGIDGMQEAKDLIDKGLMTGTVIQDPKPISEAFYSIGMNLINNEDPITNTNYKLNNGEIVVPISIQEYTGKVNTP